MASIADDNIDACTTKGEASPEHCEAWKRVLERQKTMTAEELTMFAARRADDAARYGARKKLRRTARWREVSEGSRRDMEKRTMQEVMAARDKKGISAAAKRAKLSVDSPTLPEQTTIRRSSTERPPEHQKTNTTTRVDDVIRQSCDETPRSESSGEMATQAYPQMPCSTTDLRERDELQRVLSRVIASRDAHRQQLEKEADVQQALRTQLQRKVETQETLCVQLQDEKQARRNAELELVKLTNVVSRLEDHLAQLLEIYADVAEA